MIGLGLVPLLPEVPPFLATAASPVEMVRTVPVPYLDDAPPERPTAPAPSSVHPPAAILQVVARRSRSRRQREAESGALGKAAAPGLEKQAPAPADPKVAAPKAEPPPEPDVWSDAEIIAALRDCLRRLAPLGAEIEIGQPVKQERCGAPAPVVLKRFGLGANKVEFHPPPTLNCAMVASLHTWVEKTLQPAAQELLGSPIARIRNVSGYSCRNRVGTVFHSDRLSEHALANAVDIAGFVTADGRSIEVLGQWGPTTRDLREQQERAWEAAQEAKAAAKQAEKQAADAARTARTAPKAKQAEAKIEAERSKQEAQSKREDAEQKEAAWRKTLTRTAELQKLGRGSDAGGQIPRPRRGEDKKGIDAKGPTPIPASKEGPRVKRDDQEESIDGTPAEAVFLRRVHKGACGTFGTVLGPDANEAHRNHFHFDLAARKRTAFCE